MAGSCKNKKIRIFIFTYLLTIISKLSKLRFVYFIIRKIINFLLKTYIFLRCAYSRECGEIGRHDGLKIRCLVISVRVQVPPFPRSRGQ